MRKVKKPLLEYIPDYLDWLEIEKGLSNKTQENYHHYLKNFSLWLKKRKLDDLKPHQLNPDHIFQYRVFLARKVNPNTKRSLKKSTQNYYLIALRSLLNFFTARDIQCLPGEKVELGKQRKEKTINFLKLEQVEKLLSASSTSNKIGFRDRAVLETLFSTGMRVAELASLNKEQLKIKPKTDLLEIAIVGKGGRPRTCYLSKRAINWLRKYLETREDECEALFVNYKRGAKKEARRLSVKSVENIVKKYVKIAGLPLITTPHTLRHSFATDLLQKGVDLRTVQEFLGHQNIATTQVYTHVTSKRLSDIHKRFHGKKF